MSAQYADAEALVEAVAQRIVELLDERDASPRQTRLVDADELAEALGVERKWVYQHADELGVRRLGSGRRPRLRFDLERAQRVLEAKSQRPPDDDHPRRGRPRKGVQGRRL